jgi:hypothetical protein
MTQSNFYSNIFNKESEINAPLKGINTIEQTTSKISPVTFTTNNWCTLRNTRKLKYYTHTYDPNKYLRNLKQVQTELHFPDEFFSRFDTNIKHNCCNAISIVLYVADMGEHCGQDKFGKYINAIIRTIKNVHKNLPDWIVRLYLDQSVYSCFDIIHDNVNNNASLPEESKNQIRPYLTIFNEIISSPNVELYTYSCYPPGNISRTRTLRFLTMIDPMVNLSIIREADGFVSYLDCHNIKVFAESDILFYLAQFQENYIRITKEGTCKNGSYSEWLNAYKYLVDYDFFSTHQNIYDLLAGVFSCKLKFTHEYYSHTVNSLTTQLNELISLTEEQYFKDRQIVKGQEEIIRAQKAFFNTREEYFTIGFDEILLLKMFKEIISIPIANLEQDKVYPYKIKNPADIERVNRIRDELFLSDNIYTLQVDINTTYSREFRTYFLSKIYIIELLNMIATKLIKQGILSEDILSKGVLSETNLEAIPDENNQLYSFYIIVDGILLKHIRADCNQMFNIYYHAQMQVYATELLNLAYYNGVKYDKYYDNHIGYKQKYLKYKAKYFKLKNSNKLL